MEFSDLDAKKTTNAMWDFDLLNKSDRDIFDVNFLQSQANDQANRERNNVIIQGEKNVASNDQVSKAAVVTNDQNIKDEKLAKLVSAGFETSKAQQALEVCGWDMEMAVDMLFNNQSAMGTNDRSKSPTRQSSEVIQAFGISVFKGAQKVFDYSKKKITQVVESSKNSGWMNEKRNERSELSHHSSAFQKENASLRPVYPAQSAKTEQPLDLSSTNKWPSDPKNNRPSSASSKITSSDKSSNGGQFSSPSIGQTKTESLLIGDLTDSTKAKFDEKEKKSHGNQNLDLLDSSIEFVMDNSQNILNPTPSQFSAQSIKNDPLKSLGLNQPLNFSTTNQSSQFSKNIPVVSNQQFTSLKSTNFNLQPSSSNSSLNRSRTTSQKPSNPSNLKSLDPFADISILPRSNSANSKARPMNVTKQPENVFNILPSQAGTEDPKISNFSQNEPFANTASFLPTKNQTFDKHTPLDLLDGTFDFSSASGKVTPSTSNPTTSSINVKNSSKPPFSKSFMIFDSISAGNTGTSNQSNSVYENASQGSEADIYKDKGNALFKSGQYADAEIQYSLGIKSVSGVHPTLAVLYNNRAASRLKIGSYNEAIQDCNKVQDLEPNDVKSLLRRAQAYEALEKWDDAQLDYRKILVIDPTVKSVSQSLARCAKALQSSANVPVPRSRPSKASESIKLQNVLQPLQKSLKSSTVGVTAAVQYVRDKNQQAENEDALKLSLKDQIDDKIQAWIKGKEDNLRALLSSLDAVLWKDLEWKSINLAEILTPSQVKIKYLKAIGKVHPDKLGSNISVENQLIANSVFSTLNKAWDSFKSQNRM